MKILYIISNGILLQIYLCHEKFRTKYYEFFQQTFYLIIHNCSNFRRISLKIMMSESIDRVYKTPLILRIASHDHCGFYFKNSEVVGFRLVFPHSLFSTLAKKRLSFRH